MRDDSSIDPFKRLQKFGKDDSGVVWGMIVIAITLIGAMLVFAVMGMIFDEMYVVAHTENSSFDPSVEGLETFDTMYGMVDYVPVILLFSVFLFMLVRAIMQEQY